MASPKMPRAVRATTADIGAGRYPKSLIVATASWLLLGVLLLISQAGIPESTDAQQTDVATGVQAVRAPSSDQQWFLDLLPWLGVVVIVAAVVLFVGFGWVRMALILFGVLAVVALAASPATAWYAIVAAVLLVVGSAAGLMVPAHRYLTRPRAAAGDDPAPRMVP